MDNQYTSTELFEKYLDKTLSTEEHLAFESQLNTNSTVANEFLVYKQIIKGLTFTDEKELKNKIHLITKNFEADGFFLEEDIIGDYLEGRLDKLSNDKVERRKNKDKVFAKKIEFEEKLLKGILQTDEEDLLKNIGEVQSSLNNEGFFKEETSKDIAGEITSSTNAKVIPLWQKYRAVAAIVLLAIAMGLFWLIPSRSNYNQLYADSFSQETQKLNPLLEKLGELGLGDTQRDQKTSLYDALILYEDKKIQAATVALQNHMVQFPNDLDAQFYLGLCYMEVQNFSKAIPLLTPITTQQNHFLQTDAKWYLALAFLKMDRQENKAKELLQAIALDKESNYQKRAILLLKQW